MGNSFRAMPSARALALRAKPIFVVLAAVAASIPIAACERGPTTADRQLLKLIEGQGRNMEQSAEIHRLTTDELRDLRRRVEALESGGSEQP